MLQRVLAGFLQVEGVETAMMLDDRGHLLSSVGPSGMLPAVESTVTLTSAAFDAAQSLGRGELLEVWCEGTQRTMVDIITPFRIVALHGQGGRTAQWRHAIDHARKHLATTQEL